MYNHVSTPNIKILIWIIHVVPPHCGSRIKNQDVYDILKKTTKSAESSQILFCSIRVVLSTSWVGSGRTRSYFDRGVVQNFCILGRFLLRRSCLRGDICVFLMSDRTRRGREPCRSAGAVPSAGSPRSPHQWHRDCRGREASSFVAWSSLWPSFVGTLHCCLLAICPADRPQERATY